MVSYQQGAPQQPARCVAGGGDRGWYCFLPCQHTSLQNMPKVRYTSHETPILQGCAIMAILFRDRIDQTRKERESDKCNGEFPD